MESPARRSARRTGASSRFSLLLGVCLAACVKRDDSAVSPVLYYDNKTVYKSAGSRHALARLRSLIKNQDVRGTRTPIAIDYPFNGSIFPPEIVPPTFLWHDASTATAWMVEIRFAANATRVYTLADGRRPASSPLDATCTRENNHWQENAHQKSARGWRPDTGLWAEIKQKSVAGLARIDFYGVTEEGKKAPSLVSHGTMTLQTSVDAVGAPIFYRDVPLMPARNRDGVIQPIAQADVSAIAWRLRDIAKPAAPVVMKQMPTCINCHSFSTDGRTLGMDMDGPSGDKGAYALVPTSKQIVVERDNVFSWNKYNPKKSTFGLFARVSPDGKYVASSVDEDLYVVNYMDFRFLQTFYPTRGKIAFYDRAARTIRTLRGADDPRYVQCNPVWSPDGRWIAFLRAKARNARGDGPKASFANDPLETQIQYDLYRIPFNGGNGGEPQPIKGASSTGKSVSFPKYSPNGKWIAFVQAANGLLMRPDSKLYVVPADGGEARELACNLPLMNSWHSWSPNSRWMVFSSKAFSPFTQMFLTHIDDDGNASPAVLIPNSTAPNRAVNIPEFVNLAQNGIESIATPATDYRIHLHASNDLLDRGLLDAAHREIMKAIAFRPDFAQNYSTLAFVLAKQGRLNDAMEASLKAVENAPANDWVQLNAGMFLYAIQRVPEAIEHLTLATRYNPQSARAHYFYGLALEAERQHDKALAEYDEALRCEPEYADVYNNRGTVYFNTGRLELAIADYSRAIEIEPKATFYQNRAIVFSSLHDYDRALRDADVAARMEPGDGMNWYVRGNALLQKREMDLALASFDQALAADEPPVEALEPFCNILFSTNRHEAAVQRLSAMIARHPKKVDLFKWRALANMHLGRLDEAIVDFDVVIGSVPREANAYFYKGLCLEKQGLDKAALESYALAVRFGSASSGQYAMAKQRIKKLKR